MPFRVAQGGRAFGSAVSPEPSVEVAGGKALVTGLCESEASVGGQVRLKPALMDIVRCPQAAQKGLRRFQSRSCRASA